MQFTLAFCHHCRNFFFQICPLGQGSLSSSLVDMCLVLLGILGFASCYMASFARMWLLLLVCSLRSWSRLFWSHCGCSSSSSIWASLAHSWPSPTHSTQNLLIFSSLSEEHSYQMFSFPCFINSTITFSHMFIKYLHPCNMSHLLTFVSSFSEALALHFHVGNLFHVRGMEPVWVLCISSLSPNTLFAFCLFFLCWHRYEVMLSQKFISFIGSVRSGVYKGGISSQVLYKYPAGDSHRIFIHLGFTLKALSFLLLICVLCKGMGWLS